MKKSNINLGENWARLDTDVLILGSGLAGLLLGILLHERGASVTVASKETFSDSNTFYAQGGLAAVTSNGLIDSPSDHLNDTIKSGAGLTDVSIAGAILAAAPQLVQTLVRFGTAFDINASGEFALAREGGHSKARVLHSKDTTGKAISNALLRTATDKAASSTNFNLIEYCFACNLLTDGQKISGAEVLHDGVIKKIYAKHTVLATGGAGQIYSRTTNPLVATADGVALAYRAGATLADLEFVQFHPTALALPGAPAFLISEAVRGDGAILLDSDAKPFMKKFHPDGDLATRDVVARAIHNTILTDKVPFVSLDLRPIGKRTLLQRFPNIVETCRRFGVDPTEESIPVCPAAHYFMGGVLTNAFGQTSLPGLYAIGEVASTGLHGANRLASNSLLEAGVMAIKLTDVLSAGGANPSDQTSPGRSRPLENAITEPGKTSPLLTRVQDSGDANLRMPESLVEFKSNMYEYASLTRSKHNLENLLRATQCETVAAPSLNVASMCASNLLLVGQLIATAALNRTESRGAHFREDFPQTNEALFARRQAVSAGTWNWLDSTPGFAKIDKQSTFPV
ncbi:MAG TPA: L-aspartate oxidase [Drouetiella sp.]|jgi:L-aspartate oxidase